MQFDVSVTAPANSFTTVCVCGASDFNSWLKAVGISTIYGMWVNGGYGDQWQMTASVYGGGVYMQIQSKFGAALTAATTIHILGI